MPRRLDEADDLGDQSLEAGVAADQLGVREAVLQIAHQRVGIVAEQDGADALVARGDQDRAERALADGEADRRVARRRRGSRVGVMPSTAVGLLVEAAVRVEAGVVDRLGHGAAAGQLVAHAAARDARRRRLSGVTPVTALKTRWKWYGLSPTAARQRRPGSAAPRPPRSAGRPSRPPRRGARRGRLVRPAALARPEAGRARRRRSVAWKATFSRRGRRGGAGRPAIDAGRRAPNRRTRRRRRGRASTTASQRSSSLRKDATFRVASVVFVGMADLICFRP